VNYRANIWALHTEKVTHVVSVATVGGIHAGLTPGRFCVPDQIIDYTHGRETTFAEYNGKQVAHLDFTWPYCEDMRERCMKALAQAGEDYLAAGVYAAVQGPRLETRAEIERLARDGADMVGMTGMPEAYLAREIGLCYAAVAVSANWAAGRNDSADGISPEVIEETLNKVMERMRTVLKNLACMSYGKAP
jgi:5'-methylthioadenosine phosphorylase